ncbi:MAG: hypothetical protein D8M58_17055 [Calditrichaeota bacterium]|nr:MAG: hypothetical protein DWQ03_12185 [Calditrichota bacterium]MBL1207117.1 hypothetical protein [Calditrichota bacterium]NOG46947.1 UvrD-helicase domain-containing protein [Calditrichota bacterium]
MRIDKVLNSLNKKQREAVEKPRIPVLMLAGPGTGKTRTLVARIVYQINHYKIPAEHILALTFSNKAASEMHNRLKGILKSKADKVKTGTIHSFCLDILRKYHQQVGLDAHFTVCNDEYQNSLLENLIADKVRTDRDKVARGIRTSIDHFVIREKPMPPFTAMIYDLYVEHLQKHKLIDFNQILAKTKALLIDNPDICEQYSFLYEAIHVDEFQDTDTVQYEIIKMLATKHRNIFVVADDDQSIYAWRGANPENINTFMEDFSIDTPVFLEVNYRSGPKIIDAAHSVVKDTERVEPEKFLKAGDVVNDSIRTQFFDNEEQELNFIFEKLELWKSEKKIPYSEMAVLYPQHRFSEQLALKLVRERTPFQQASGRNFADNPQMKKIILYLQVIRDPLDSLLLEELVESELGYNPHKQIQNIQKTSKSSYRKALYDLSSRREISEDLRRILATFIGNLANLVNLKTFFSFGQLINQIIIGLQDMDKSYIEEKAPKFEDFSAQVDEKLMSSRNAIWVYHSEPRFVFIAEKIVDVIFPGRVKVLLDENFNEINKSDFVVLLSPFKETIEAKYFTLFRETSKRRESVFSTLIRWCQNHLAKRDIIFENYVVFDLETTGRNPNKCGVVEIAAVKVKNSEIVENYQTLVNPEMAIDPEAAKVHNISDADVAKAPTMENVWKEFKDFIGDDILIAHNGYAFDFRIIDRFAKKIDGTKINNVRYDSLIFARQMYPNDRNSIDALSQKFELDPGNRHRALDDVKVLHHIFQKILEEKHNNQKKVSGDFLFEYAALAIFLENKLVAYEDKVIFLAGVQKLLSPYSKIFEEYCNSHNYKNEELYGQIAQKAQQLYPGILLYNHQDDFKRRVFDIAAEFENLPLNLAMAEFLSLIMLVNPTDKLSQADAVSLLTFHAAKGLEFKKVIIMGMEDDSMPSYFAYKENDYDDRPVDKKLDEQKRLLYVGLTRAKEEIIMTAVKNRFGRAQKSSPFLRDIIKHLKEK